jgi:hypothetical protein
MRTAVRTPTMPAVIHAPCHSGSDVSFTLDKPFSYPSPDTFLDEQELRSTVAEVAIRAVVAARLKAFKCMG